MGEKRAAAVARLRELEAEERHSVGVMREQLDRVGIKRGIAANIIAAEAAATAYATAADIVDGRAI